MLLEPHVREQSSRLHSLEINEFRNIGLQLPRSALLSIVDQIPECSQPMPLPESKGLLPPHRSRNWVRFSPKAACLNSVYSLNLIAACTCLQLSKGMGEELLAAQLGVVPRLGTQFICTAHTSYRIGYSAQNILLTGPIDQLHGITLAKYLSR